MSRIDGLRVIGELLCSSSATAGEGSQAIAPRAWGHPICSRAACAGGRDTVRISASLVKADDGSTVWAEQYDGLIATRLRCRTR